MRPWRRAARRERVRETSKRQSNPIRVRVVGTRVYGFSSHSRTYRHVEIPFGRRGTVTALDPLHIDRHRVLVAVIFGKIEHVSARLGLLRRGRARRELTHSSLCNLRHRHARVSTPIFFHAVVVSSLTLDDDTTTTVVHPSRTRMDVAGAIAPRVATSIFSRRVIAFTYLCLGLHRAFTLPYDRQRNTTRAHASVTRQLPRCYARDCDE